MVICGHQVVLSSGEAHTISRRYTHFANLAQHAQALPSFARVKTPFPSKVYFVTTTGELDRRQEQLEAWLRALVAEANRRNSSCAPSLRKLLTLFAQRGGVSEGSVLLSRGSSRSSSLASSRASSRSNSFTAASSDLLASGGDGAAAGTLPEGRSVSADGSSAGSFRHGPFGCKRMIAPPRPRAGSAPQG